MISKHTINAEIKCLKDIVANDMRLYQIPNYQRPYTWDSDNLSELIDDLTEAYIESKDEEYFCGSLVLVENQHDGRYDVVDGQQRLTTFVIMACVFRDSYNDVLSVEAMDYVKKSIKKRRGNEPKLKLLTADNYQVKFQEDVLKDDGIDFNKPQEKNNRYLHNAYHIKKLLRDKLKQSEVSEFVEWMYEKVVLTNIICNSEDGAIRIFDVLNSRGIPLTPVDILKARLMQLLSLQEERKAFSSTWSSIDEYLKNAEFTMDDMLNTYLYYRKAPNSKERLDKALGKIFKEEKQNPIFVVNDLDKFSKSYCGVLTESDKYSYCLQYLNHQIYWRSILVTANFVGYPHIPELKAALVAYFYQNWIAGAYVTRIKQTCLTIITEVKSGKSIDEIKATMQKNLTKDENKTTEKFKEELSGNYVYGKKWDRPLLLLLEYFSMDNSNPSFIKLENKLHIEHILPKKVIGDWKSIFSDEQASKWTDSLANLALLSGRKNSQASNNSFDEKKRIYKGSQASAFVTTREIADCPCWNEEQLKKRKNEQMKKIMKKLDLFNAN